MPVEDIKGALQHRLVERILTGPGAASAEQRARAFHNTEPSGPLRLLLDKVATRPDEIVDADYSAASEAGFTDQQLFELVICAAVGAASRQYEAGLAALAEATAAPGSTS